MKTIVYRDSLDTKPTGLYVTFVEIVMGWKWLTDHHGSSHWQGPDGKCHTFIPQWVTHLRTDQIRALIRHEGTRKKK